MYKYRRQKENKYKNSSCSMWMHTLHKILVYNFFMFFNDFFIFYYLNSSKFS